MKFKILPLALCVPALASAHDPAETDTVFHLPEFVTVAPKVRHLNESVNL